VATVASCCRDSHDSAVFMIMLQRVAVCRTVLQCVIVLHCPDLQCLVVSCYVLQFGGRVHPFMYLFEMHESVGHTLQHALQSTVML